MGRRDGLGERTGMGREEREGVEGRQEEKKRWRLRWGHWCHA